MVDLQVMYTETRDRYKYSNNIIKYGAPSFVRIWSFRLLEFSELSLVRIILEATFHLLELF